MKTKEFCKRLDCKLEKFNPKIPEINDNLTDGWTIGLDHYDGSDTYGIKYKNVYLYVFYDSKYKIENYIWDESDIEFAKKMIFNYNIISDELYQLVK